MQRETETQPSDVSVKIAAEKVESNVFLFFLPETVCDVFERKCDFVWREVYNNLLTIFNLTDCNLGAHCSLQVRAR